MPHKSSLFSLAALTRAYRRNLAALVRVAKPVKGKKRAPVQSSAVARKAARAAPRRTTPLAGTSSEWLAGIAPGPAGARRFHLFVPAGLAPAPGESFPLLVMLHGCGQTGRDLAASSRMNRLAARKRFLVLYPEQERVANAHGCWNWYDRRSGKADAEAATLLAAVDQVARRHPVDLGRVAVAGLSAGGSMAALLAARYPSRFCAVVMHSGVAPGTAESAATAVAAMRGSRDAHLPIAQAPLPAGGLGGTGDGAAADRQTLPPLLILHGDADGVVSVRNAAATAVLWADAAGARATASRTLRRGQRYPMQAMEFKAHGQVVVSVREITGLGHAWSGGAPGLPHSDPAGPDASALAWAFVARQFGRLA
jgi:poly(hydroxyalkanoate) depolymerase family esterase